MTSLWDDLDSLVNSPSSFEATTGERGTIKPKANFDAGDDAVELRKAIEGLGTKDKVLIDILTHRSSAQRQLICEAYLEATGRGAGTKDSVLIEIFASRSNQQIKALSDVYLEETEKKLTRDLKKEISGDFSNALLLLAEGKRDDSTAVDAEKAKEDAKTLYDAGEKKWGTDESKFVDILCHRSIPQLRQTLVEYKNISGKTLQQSIEGEMSGELEELLVAIVKCVKSEPAYFAERLYESMKGCGTDESTLNRIMVSRSEIDMLDIRAEFKKLYEYSLHSAIESDCRGKWEKSLLKMCGGDDE
ncbi:annexin A3a isoform X3 [Eleginops maclovinus]|uniref:annexin A3a isoform X3 n=1 Tax=Eleginops maclovinus TaxID=56733 RepID=UPI003080AB3F